MSFLGEDSSSDVESHGSLHQLTINEHYANAFQYKKEREELSKLKEKYGSDYEDVDEVGDESDSETEDEDGEELTPAVDAAILRTLSRIQKKDPAIYDNNQGVFEDEAKRTAASTPWGYKAPAEKSKPLTLQQQKVQSLLGPRSPSPAPQRPTHVEQQRVLRDETINAFRLAVSDDDDDNLEGGLLTLRERSKDELERQEEEYRAYLEREVGDLESLVRTTSNHEDDAHVKQSDDNQKKLEKTSKKRKKRAEDSDDQFLMNYIFNRGWIDRQSRHLPTYSELTGRDSGTIAPVQKSSDVDSNVLEGISGNPRQLTEDGAEIPDVDELEEFDEMADVFESTYNFRFEEPGATVIQSHPRQISSAVRREDTSRKEARERKKARKAEALAKQNEEVKRLKALKMREIRQRLDTVSKESGLTTEELESLDIEGEWDPAKHDAQMANIYGADANANADEVADDGKPAWNDEIDIADIVPSEKKSKKQKKKEERRKAKAAALAEDGVGVDVDAMDADAAPSQSLGFDDEEWDGTEEMRKQKLDEYMNELYGLEFNDIVGGDLPTRFKYAPVQKSSFGLTAAEILTATDAELNEYVSLKKLTPYRKSKGWDVKQVERLRDFREKIRGRAGTSQWSSASVEPAKKKRKGRKEREKVKMVTAAIAQGAGSDRDADDAVR